LTIRGGESVADVDATAGDESAENLERLAASLSWGSSLCSEKVIAQACKNSPP